MFFASGDVRRVRLSGRGVGARCGWTWASRPAATGQMERTESVLSGFVRSDYHSSSP